MFWKAISFLGWVISAGFILLASVVVILQVVLRYVFGMGFIWIPELARYSIIAASLVGAGLVMKEDHHPSVDVLSDLYPEPVKKIADIVFDIIILLFLIFFAREGWIISTEATGNTPALRIPWRYPYFSIALGSAFMILFTIKRLIENFKKVLHQRWRE